MEDITMLGSPVLLLVSLATVIVGQDSRSKSEVQAAFERRYHAWEVARETPPEIFSSDIPAKKELAQIAALGIPALPMIIDRMEHGSGLDFLLGEAVREITRKEYERADFPPDGYGDAVSRARMYAQWWHGERGRTPRIFAERYAEWQRLKEDGKLEEARKQSESLGNLGLDALPLMMEKIAAGDADLLALVNNLTEQALGDAPTRAQALEWWAANKEKWTLPPSAPTASAPATIAPSTPSASATSRTPLAADDVKMAFERRYAAWKLAAREPNEIVRSSTPAEKEFNEITALGMPALPLIIDRIERDEPMDFLLALSVWKLTEKGFARDEYPQPEAYGDVKSAAKLYVKWWREGRGETPRLFAERYPAWRKYKESGQAPPPHGLAEEERVLLFLGLDALPLMMEKIAAGDEDLLAIVNKLTKQSLGEAPTRAHALDWWAANKEKWTLPPSTPATSAPQHAPPTASAPSTGAPTTHPAPPTSQPTGGQTP